MMVLLLVACDVSSSAEGGADLEWLQPTLECTPAGPRYVVSGSIAGVPLGDCALWACGDVHQFGGATFAIEVEGDPCRLDVNCRDDGRIGRGSIIEATRTTAVGLALRYPTSAEMHIPSERSVRKLQGVARLARRASTDMTRSDERRAERARHADDLEHQIRRAQERRALGEE